MHGCGGCWGSPHGVWEARPHAAARTRPACPCHGASSGTESLGTSWCLHAHMLSTGRADYFYPVCVFHPSGWKVRVPVGSAGGSKKPGFPSPEELSPFQRWKEPLWAGGAERAGGTQQHRPAGAPDAPRGTLITGRYDLVYREMGYSRCMLDR